MGDYRFRDHNPIAKGHRLHRSCLLLLSAILLVSAGCLFTSDRPVSSGGGGNPEGYLYVLNQADSTLYIYDSRTLERLDSFSTGIAEPHFIELAPDGVYYYVVGRVENGSGQLVKYRTSDNARIAEAVVPGRLFATAFVISNNSDTLYLTDFDAHKGRLHRYDISGTNFTYLDSTIQAGWRTHDIANSSDGNTIVTAGFSSDDIHLLNTATTDSDPDLFPLTLDSARIGANITESNRYGPYGVRLDHTGQLAIMACRKGVDQIRLINIENMTVSGFNFYSAREWYQ